MYCVLYMSVRTYAGRARAHAWLRVIIVGGVARECYSMQETSIRSSLHLGCSSGERGRELNLGGTQEDVFCN